MKRYSYILLLPILCCAVFTGCDKYLDIKPKGKTLLTRVTDYDQWLNDPSLFNSSVDPSGWTNYMTDNVDYVNVPTPQVTPRDLIYTWSLQFLTNLNSPPLLWGQHYAKINQYNTVLLGVDQATGGTASQKSSLKAEALLARALEYFYLVNEFGKSYDSTTVSKDLAVPFVTSNDVTQIVPPRSTVAEIYKHLIDDVNAAIPNLPADNSANRLRGSTAAGYSVLARIYFYAGNYTEARKNAELALASTRAVMINFNGTLPSSNLISIRPDVIYGRFVGGNLAADLDFMRSFTSDDLRVKMLYQNTDNYTFTIRGATIFFPAAVTPVLQDVNIGTSPQEMRLIIAEAAARSNDLATALQQLDEIRKNRIATASYVPFQSSDKQEVLQEVLLERNHELAFTGLRWFDMRRLDKENRMGTVNRYDATGKIIATLPLHSNRYTLQIPVQVLSFNPGMPQNP